MNILRKLSVILILLSPMAAQADLISVDDRVFGADSVTLDTDTGLEWLDVTMSKGRPLTDLYGLDGSINDFTNTSGDYFGWRYAVEDEVLQFFTNAGLSPPTPAPQSEGYGDVRTIVDDPLIAAFLDLTGRTNVAGNYSMYWDEGFGLPDFSGVAGVEQYFGSGQANPGEADRIFFGQDGNEIYNINPNQGNWLVRNAQPAQIPEPGTLALLGLGLAGIGVSRRRKR